MKFKNISTIAAAVTASMFAASSAYAVRINADGPGGVGTVQANTIDFAPGNALVTCVACVDDQGRPVNDIPSSGQGSIVQNFGHMTTSSLLQNGVNASPTGFGSDFEWTVKFAFLEVTALDVGLPGGVFSTVNAIIEGGTNFFEIYYDGTPDASNLAGTGFSDGTLILSGTILPFDGSVGSTTFTGLGVGPRFDNFGTTDSYTSIDTVVGNGGGSLQVQVNFRNPQFFLDDITELLVPVDTLLGLAFNQVDPSSCFTPTAGVNTAASLLGAGNGYGGCGVAPTGSVGTVNGVNGLNAMFQTDASAAVQAVPEPTSMALLGLGFVAMGASARRRRA